MTVLGVAVLCIGLVGYAATRIVRIDSFYGNMVPRLAWAWTPVEGEHFADYQLTRPVSIERDAVESTPVPEIDETDFPEFLGTDRTGVISNSHLSDWEAQKPELRWRKPVGVGWAGILDR